MDPICPLLTLGSDRRAVCDAVDIDHRCEVPGGPDPVPRRQQVEFCLSSRFAECAHFARHGLLSSSIMIEGIPPPSPDVVMATTRLVIDPVFSSRSVLGPTRRPFVAALALVVAGTGAIGFGAVDQVANLLGAAAEPAGGVSRSLPAATQPAAPSHSPTPTPTPTPTATPVRSPLPSSAPTATAVASTPPRSEAPAQRTYIVQPGDTLKAIADRYGTTVAALQAANEIVDENLIEAGRELIIP